MSDDVLDRKKLMHQRLGPTEGGTKNSTFLSPLSLFLLFSFFSIFRIELPIGSRVPFHCTASGKCYLASLDAKQFNDVVGTIRFEPRTPNTITSKEQLQSEIQVVRERGYAIDNEELFRDMCALAVPVNDSDGKFLAALAYHGPTQRLNVETLVDHLETMREGAAKLAELMR